MFFEVVSVRMKKISNFRVRVSVSVRVSVRDSVRVRVRVKDDLNTKSNV